MLAREPRAPRTLVFASFDGEEAWSTGKAQTAGSRAYLEKLGPRARELVGALVVEMCGWKGGTPVSTRSPTPTRCGPAARWSRPAG